MKDQSSGLYYAGAVSTDATNRIQYAAHGAVSVMKLGNGLWEHTNFNNRLQATQIGLGTSSTSSSMMGLTYGYGTTNNNGNVLSISYSGGGLSYTQNFGYDQLNRLTTSSEGSSWSQTNSYDRYGNRSIVGGALTFNAANNRITTAGYTYDASGNLTNDTLHLYTFDAENKISKVDAVSAYVYNGEGQRVKKLVGENTRFVYGIGGQLVAEFDGMTAILEKEYVQAGATLITIEPTAVNSNGARYTTSDTLGSPQVVTNSSASVVSRHDYMPFGEELGVGVGGRTSGIGFGAMDGLRQKFTRKERDNETGLDYFNARYFASTQGRFINADSFAGSTINPQSLNRYAYVLGNPLRFKDPSGHLAIAGASGDLNDWWKRHKTDGYLFGMKPSTPIGLCGSGCGGQNPSQPQDPNKASLPPAIAPSGVAGIPAGTVGTPTVSEFQPIPPHKSFWERVNAFFGFGSVAAAGTGSSMWGRPETLDRHFIDHGSDFGSSSADEYAQQAQDFFLRAIDEGLPMKIGPDGVIRVYDSETNTFASYNMNGSTKTFFKPNDEEFYWLRQPGRVPWFPRGSDPEAEPEAEPEIEPEGPIEPIP